MSWQLGAFGILGVGLLAGFAWYERTRPDARIVALVGTLAAFAALGRIAFAAVPNVKPTSDIVLISGYALGGAPGYVVGAVAALTSNFFFGQGPWTPWQMAGWGITGLAGALLAWLTRGHIGRLPLALVSFALGFAFTALQDVGDWVTYSDHSLAQLGVYVGKGIGFDLVHAAGCFGFALLFGPALIRALKRFRTRIQVTWLPPLARVGIPVLLVMLVVGSFAKPTRAATVVYHPSAQVRYLLSRRRTQMAAGGRHRVSRRTRWTPAWSVIALARGGFDPRGAERNRGRNPFAYLLATLATEGDAGSIERTALAVDTVSNEWGQFQTLHAKLSKIVGRNGSVDGQTNLTTFAILALRSAGIAVPANAIAWLARQQDGDGGFNYATRGGASDVDDTGAVIDALAGTGHTHAIARAVAFIRSQQNRDGGFGDELGAGSNAQSTAFAVCGLIAARVDAARLHRNGARSPLAYLRSLIQPGGPVDYSRGNSQSPIWVTAEAEIALSGHTL